IEGVALQLYEHMKPALESIVAAVKRGVDWFARLSPGTQQVIVVITALSAAIGPLLLVLGMFASSLGSIISLVGTLGPAIAGIAGPVGIAVAAIAGLGVGVANLINHFKKSSIEVDLFGDKVSEATQEAVGGFLKLNDQATIALNQLNWSGQVVTQNIANNIISTFDQMGDQVLAAMQQDHQAQLAQMQNFFAQSSTLTEQEKQEALAKLQQHQQQEQQTIQQGQ